jgi:hypothetical protein
VIGDRWGVTDAEVERHYPCDEFISAPKVQAWRGVTVRAAPEALWPWVRQIQWAPYSYDVIDNLGRRSPRRLRDARPPVPGENFSSVGDRPVGRLLAVEPPAHYTGRIIGAVLSYVLAPAGDGRTRLLLKIVANGYGPLAPVMVLGDLVMARRQLLNLKRLAENPPR